MNFAEQLRKQAQAKQEETFDHDIEDAVAFIKGRAQGRASQGGFELRLNTEKLPFERNVLERALPKLRQLGFSAEIKDEIIWYNNTDGDTDTYLIINW